METKEHHVRAGRALDPQESATPGLITLAALDEMPCTSGACAYCREDSMVYALQKPTCRRCALETIEVFGAIFVPAQPSRPRPPSTLDEQREATCAWCRKPIRRTGAGADWYHRHNASTSCYLGSRSWKRANPCEVA